MTFKLSTATPSDIPGILAVHYACWNDPKSHRIFPDTDAARSWMSASMKRGIENRDGGGTTFLVCKDEEGRIAGWAKWYLEQGDNAKDDVKRRNGVTTWSERWTGDEIGWEGMSEEIFGGEFMEPMMRQHEVIMKGRPHYFLEALATHPDFRKKGIASQLVNWGVEKADELGVEMYLDASSMGLPLYEKYGWVAKRELKDEKCTSVPMWRPKKGGA